MKNNKFTRIRNILIAVLVFNWLVAFAKIIYGNMSHCYSMMSDGFHSFSDGASNIVGIIAVLIAARPADKDHPYGHRKYETFASVAISVLLFVISFNLIRGAIARFMNPVVPEVDFFSFSVMLFTILVNVAIFFYERKKSKELQSDILFADSEHTRSDIFVSASVIFTLLAIKAGFPMVDTIVAVVISIFIALSAVNILRAASRVLCDKAAVVSDKIKSIVIQIEGVQGCHRIRTRGRSDDIYIDMHVLVDPSMSVGNAHNISEKIENKIKKNINGVTDVVVHIEPKE